jgi:hypothetical protein
MRESTCKSLVSSLEKIAVLTLVLSLLGVRSAFARAGGIPGPPPPPPPPCITTATLQENGSTTGSYICSVRNGGVVSHNVTIRIVNSGNGADSGNRTPASLAPGKTTSEGFSPPSDETSADACVVTTDEGATDALSDLVVVLQFSDPAGETEGKIVNSCASPVLPPS